MPKLNNTFFHCLRLLFLFIQIKQVMFAGNGHNVNEVSAVLESYAAFIDIFGRFGTVNVSPLLKKSKMNAMKICVNGQTNIEMGMSD